MTMITPSYLGETIEYSSLHACRSTLEDPTGEFRLLADFEQRVLLANRAVLRHVAPGLAHEPDGSAVDSLRFAGANEEGVGCGHEPITLALCGWRCVFRGCARLKAGL